MTVARRRVSKTSKFPVPCSPEQSGQALFDIHRVTNRDCASAPLRHIPQMGVQQQKRNPAPCRVGVFPCSLSKRAKGLLASLAIPQMGAGKENHFETPCFASFCFSGTRFQKRASDARPEKQNPPPFVGGFILLCGEKGIRTLGTLVGYIRFPSVHLRPLGHLSGWCDTEQKYYNSLCLS